MKGAAVLLEGDRIVAVGKPDVIPAGTKVIDLGEATLMPGFIDAHAHPLIHTDSYQMDHIRRSSAYKALLGLKAVQRQLQNGWTSLRIPGDADIYYAHLEIRRVIEEGLFVGPRIAGAGHYISVTGGGGDVNFIAPEQRVLADGLVVDGPDEVRKAIRQEIKNGSDWIKLLVTGAFMSVGDDPTHVHFSPEELRAAVEEAGRRGVPVMAHAHAAEGIKQAVRAGVRSIEHGTFMDDEAIELMVENGVFLVPTIYIGEYYIEEGSQAVDLEKHVELSKKYHREFVERVRKAIRRGVKVVVGSDFGGFPNTVNVREFASLVDAGMTPMQAIQAGTRVGAELLGWDDRLGTIHAGKLADLVAVPGDPLQDISALQDVSFVMLGGKVIKLPDEVPAP
jgi:imidazolonepropionase-like amidohydrolase